MLFIHVDIAINFSLKNLPDASVKNAPLLTHYPPILVMVAATLSRENAHYKKRKQILKDTNTSFVVDVVIMHPDI